MNIDLVYYFREVNHNYFLNGPEKVNGNIVNNSPAYQLTTANDVVTKINQMIASLAPDITNVGLVTSELYTGGIQVNTYSGELNVSSAPDYTSILTSINTNLTNLNNKFITNLNNQQGRNLVDVISSIFQYDNGASSIKVSGQISDGAKYHANIVRGIWNLMEMFYESIGYADNPVQSKKLFQKLENHLKQSVSPNASITDVISALNTNIHNDLTNINTTTENKDTILLIDGQQEFKLRNKEEMDF